jgi:uncharacterized membrane protein
MKTNTVLFIVVVIGVVILIAVGLLGARMEGPIANHWNAAGEADGYGTTFSGLYFLPLLTMGLTIFLMVMPSIDPLKANVESFRPNYNIFVLTFAGFMYYIHSLTIAWNLGFKFQMNVMMAPAFGILFIVVGWLVKKAKRNFFIGIRTPWTLSNDIVWEKTHRLGGTLFMISGILITGSAALPFATMWILLGSAIGGAVISVVYSYIVFRQLEQKSVE